VVTVGWDDGDEFGEEEESEDAGNEFERRMETDTDDGDLRRTKARMSLGLEGDSAGKDSIREMVGREIWLRE
jgi:hypothetical protein